MNKKKGKRNLTHKVLHKTRNKKRHNRHKNTNKHIKKRNFSLVKNKTRKFKLKGGGNFMPQGLKNLWWSGEDVMNNIKNMILGQPNGPSSNVLDQKELLKEYPTKNKYSNIKLYNQIADDEISKLLQA